MLDLWLSLVHQFGVEVQVTLLASGHRITGHLTPIQRYTEWQREVFSRAALEKGFTLPSLELPPITPEQTAKVKAAWPEMEKQIGETGFATLCLRNAKVHEPMPMHNWSCPFLLVATGAVAAFFPGVHS